MFHHIHVSESVPCLSVAALLSSATANGFQMVVNGAQSKALPDFQITNIQGRLSGHGIEEQLPTIIITAHYDATGVAPVSHDQSSFTYDGHVVHWMFQSDFVEHTDHWYGQGRTGG